MQETDYYTLALHPNLPNDEKRYVEIKEIKNPQIKSEDKVKNRNVSLPVWVFMLLWGKRSSVNIYITGSNNKYNYICNIFFSFLVNLLSSCFLGF